MKSRRLAVSICATFLAIASSGAAWAAHDGHHRHGGGSRHDPGVHLERKLEKLATQAELTPQQREQARKIFSEAAQQAKAIHADASLHSQARHEKLWALRASTHRSVQALLTPAQVAKLKAWHETRRYQRIDRRVQHLKEELGLGDDVAKRVGDILRNEAKERQAMHEADRDRKQPLSAEQRQAMRDKHRALHDSTQKAIVALLTPDQREVYADLQNDFRGHHRGRGHRGHHGGHESDDMDFHAED